jgi:hypothetical protein
MLTNRKESFLAVSIAVLLLLSTCFAVVPAVAPGLPAGADIPEWYETVKGVLNSDTYSLYPYQKKSLNIGFSKFGEMLNLLDKVGLEYDTRDPFAPPAGPSIPVGIPQRKWFSGWLINITYRHATASPSYRNIWAVALHASVDTTDYGNGWIRVDNGLVDVSGGKKVGLNVEWNEDPADPGNFLTEDGLGLIPGAVDGGRKTNGSAVTLPMKVLYDGPRRYVAQLETIISDVLSDTAIPLVTEPLVKIVYTIDFNKVKKEVNVIKDVKLLFVKFQYGIETIDPWAKADHNAASLWPHNVPYDGDETLAVSYQGMYVQFSNRGEWDLGPAPVFDSYAHFYTDGPGENKFADAPQNNPSWEGLATAYDREYALIRTAPPNKNARWGIEPDVNGLETYDVAQVISSDLKYVGFAAFWPSLSDWSVDGVTDNLWWKSLVNNDIHREDCRIEPFTSPFVIGEWDFILTPTPFYDPVSKIEGDLQFRGVTVYGVTDLNMIDGVVGVQVDSIDAADRVKVGDGDDENRALLATNILDREVYYQLSEVFKPWDLQKSVSKMPGPLPVCNSSIAERHVDKYVGSGYDRDLDATWTYAGYIGGAPFRSKAYDFDGIIGDDDKEKGEWWAYSTFAERIIDDGVLLKRGKDYVIIDKGAPDLLNCTIHFINGGSGKIKILYSVDEAAYEFAAVGQLAASVDSIGAAMVTQAFAYVRDITVQWGAVDTRDFGNGETVPFLMAKFGAGWAKTDYYYDIEEESGDYRLALKDDWSTTVPIASASLIGVGGPVPNLVAEYFNEFSPVIWRGTYFGIADLLPVSDYWWNKGTDVTAGPYNVEKAVKGPLGYAVVTAYKDINGTIGFMVWGLTANDTFWASQALFNTGGIAWKPGIDIYKNLRLDDSTQGGNGNGDLDTKDPLVDVPLKVVVFLLKKGWSMEEISLKLTESMVEDIMTTPGDPAFDEHVPLIEFLKYENCGVTAIVLKIDYSYATAGDVHPSVTIVEELGTKTEKPQHDP